MRGPKAAGRADRGTVRGIAPIFAVLVVIALVVLGAIAWHEGGPQPVNNVVVPLQVPGETQGQAK